MSELRDAAQEYFEASLPLLNDYPLTDEEGRRAWERLREANRALRVALDLPISHRAEFLDDVPTGFSDMPCLDCDMNPGLCDVHGATPLTKAELANYPIRVVVDQHGHYWRDYGDHWSMCPVSEENRATEPVHEFYPLDHIDVARLHEAARRNGMPRVVSVADIEDLASEYNYLATVGREVLGS